MSVIYQNQIGVRFEVETAGDGVVDWADAETLELRIKLPDGNVQVWNPTLEGLTKLIYTTLEASDLPQSGMYRLQARVAGAGYDALGKTVAFNVSAPFR